MFDIFKKYDNILYLDSDTLMLKPIDEMLDIKTDRQVVAVSEMTINKLVKKRYFPIYLNNGIDLQDYVNSGVLLFKTCNFSTDDP